MELKTGDLTGCQLEANKLEVAPLGLVSEEEAEELGPKLVPESKMPGVEEPNRELVEVMVPEVPSTGEEVDDPN